MCIPKRLGLQKDESRETKVDVHRCRTGGISVPLVNAGNPATHVALITECQAFVAVCAVHATHSSTVGSCRIVMA